MINFSNHPSGQWSDEQRAAAIQLSCSPDSAIINVPFPSVDPEAEDVSEVISDNIARIIRLMEGRLEPVFVAGEFTVAFGVTAGLLARGYRVVTSTTQRMVKQLPDGTTVRQFQFVQWRTVKYSVMK